MLTHCLLGIGNRGRTSFASIVLVALTAGLSGCASLDSIHRTGQLLPNEKSGPEYQAEGQYITTDAKQRIVTYMRVDADTDFAGRVRIGKIVCAEPSPDVAQALQQALSTSLSATTGAPGRQISLGGDFGYSAAESVAQLGKRIATIQLLRDELADLCRSFANGAVSTTTYTVRLSRLDKKMITLLVSEAASGALNQPPISVLGTSGAGSGEAASPESVAAAERERGEALKELQAAEQALANAPETQKAAKLNEHTLAAQKLQQKDLAVLQLRVRAARTQVGALVPSVGISSGSTPPSAESVAVFSRIQRNFLDDDDLSTILDACISTLDVLAISKETSQEAKNRLADAQKKARNAENTLQALRAKVSRLDGATMSRKRSIERLEQSLTAAPTEQKESLGRVLDRERSAFNDQIAELEVVYAEGRAAEDALKLAQRELDSAERSLDQDRTSKFGQWCRSEGMPRVMEAIRFRDENRHAEVTLELQLSHQREALQKCAPLLSEGEKKADENLLRYCRKLFAELSTVAPKATPSAIRAR